MPASPLLAGAGRETHPAATGTVALPKIRVNLREFAVAIYLLRNWLALNVICMRLYFHDENLTRSAKNQKTYRRLFGMIFFGGFGSLLIPDLQWLATRKILKNGQNTKAKYHFYFPKPRFSCQNAPKKACFSVSTKKWRGVLIVKALRQSRLR
jgi:hypothetical protein